MAAGKQYGLILSGKKSNPTLRAKLSIFGDDDDEDEPQSVGRTLMKEGMKMKTKKQTQVDIERVLSEDPTAYQYDEVYDNEIAKKKLARKPVIVKETKPKYIDSLLKTAKARQQEYENRIERKVQKEREAEGDEFADKEAFVTTAYRKKMEERQALEDEEKRQAILEAKMDVTKQKDLSGFYRHVLDDLIGNDEKSQEETIHHLQSTSEETQTTTKDNHNVEKSLSHDFSKETKLNKRNIRTRRSSSESSSDEPRRQAEKTDVGKSSPAKKLRERSRTPQSPPSRKRKDKSRSQSPPSRKGRERSRSQSPPSRKGRERSRSQSPPSRKRRERSRSQSQPQRRRRVRSRSPQRRNRSRSPRRRQRSRSPARRSHHRRQKSRSPYQNRQRKRSTSPQRRERRREKSPHKRQERDRSTERKHSSRRESTNKKSERVVEEKVEETKDEIKENKEQELKMILEKYARRNTEETIEAARERFFERMKQRGLVKTIITAN